MTGGGESDTEDIMQFVKLKKSAQSTASRPSPWSAAGCAPASSTWRRGAFLAVVLLSFAMAGRGRAQYFPEGSEPCIYLNWQSFEDVGFPAGWRDRVIDLTLRAVGRWMFITGTRLRPKFCGLTTQFETAGALTVRGVDMDLDPDVLARAAFSGPWVNVYRRFSNGALINWVVYRSTTAVDMGSVMLHELGHALYGLPDIPLPPSGTPRRAMVRAFGTPTYADLTYGPFPSDRDAVLSTFYGERVSDKMRFVRSTDNGASWTSPSSNLQNLTRTTLRPAIIRDSSTVTVLATDPYKQVVRLSGSTSGTFGSPVIYAGKASFYGMGADGLDGKYLWAWVDPSGSDMRIRVMRTTDGGSTWTHVDPPSSVASVGTPDVCYLGGSSWLLVYQYLNWNDPANAGRLAGIVTTSDGSSWGPAQYIGTIANRPEMGVSCAAIGSSVRVSWSFSANYFTNTDNVRVRTTNVVVSGTTISTPGTSVVSANYSRDGMSITENSAGFVGVFRGTDGGSSFYSQFATVTAGSWGEPATKVLHVLTASPAVGGDVRFPWVYGVEVRP